MNTEITTETIKSILTGDEYTNEQKVGAVRWLLSETNKNNPGAIYTLATLVNAGLINPSPVRRSKEEEVLSLMLRASGLGHLQARAFINSFCKQRYESRVKRNIIQRNHTAGLVGFDNKPIKINARGLLSPVDAVLTFENGVNILTLTVPLTFVNSEFEDEELYKKAVINGIMDWQGEYEVFGGQKLKVVVNVSEEVRIFDTVYVMALTRDSKEAIKDVMDKLHISEKNQGYRNVIKSNRSFASLGIKWKTTSRKIIYMQSENHRFDDYDELKAVARHEFGHVLGLGDLYKSTSDDLDGVPLGTYCELDCYYISNSIYNLVMCDHHADVTNNDIEMVVLAFSKNKMQLFQRLKRNTKVSEALGRGN